MKLRALNAADREQMARWIELDPEHRETTTPEFFCAPGANAESMAFEDEQGVVFYVRITRVLRVDMQFAPQSEVGRERAVPILHEGFKWLTAQAQESGFRQVLFQSKFAPLIRFCERRFGFRRSPDEIVLAMAAADRENS